MKRNCAKGYAMLCVLLILISVVAFAVPTKKTATFWIVYVFTMIACLAQIAIWKIAFGKDHVVKSKIIGLSIITVGVIYLIIQIIALAIFMAIPIVPSWIAVVVCALILGVFVFCLIWTEAGREEINEVERKIEKKVFYIKSLQVDLEMLANIEKDDYTKGALEKLAEKIRYSDPMSNDALVVLEAEIASKVKALKSAKNKMAIIMDLDLLITERNKKCKILK